MSLNLKSVEVFVVAAETLNFSETARRLATVQSAVSSHIDRLENDLGRRLIDRGRGRGMMLTPAGRVFLHEAMRLLQVADEAVDVMRTQLDCPTIRLGTTSTLASSVVPKALHAFSAAGFRARFEITCARSYQIMEGCHQNEYDIALIVDQGTPLERVFSESSKLCWLAAPHFNIDGTSSLPLVFLTSGRDLRKHAISALTRAGRGHHVAHLSSDPAGVRALVAAGLAVTVAPALAAPSEMFGAVEMHTLPNPGKISFSCYLGPGIVAKEAEVLCAYFRKEISIRSVDTEMYRPGERNG